MFNEKFDNLFKIILAVLITVSVSSAFEPSNSDLSPIFFIISFLVIFLFLIKLMSNFLNNDESSSFFTDLIRGISGVLRSKESDDLINASKVNDDSKVNDNKKVNIEIDESEIIKVIDQVKSKIENISNEHYFSEFRENLRVQILIENFQYKISGIESRVRGEINRLSKSAIINLSLGMMLSIGGITYLGIFILDAKEFEDFEHMLMSIFPRSVFVLLIEVFAYFFLKLYKQNLDDIKYYQNELTNIESKHLAVQIAKQSSNHKLISMCVEEFLKTERNFILEKDQSTIELEKERISSNNANNTLQAVKDIFSSKK